MSLSDLLKDFLLQKRLAGLSEQTIKDYDNMIGIFLRFVGPDTPTDCITYSVVQDYILDLFKRNLSKATTASYIRNLRIFLRWVHKEYGLSFEPSKIIVPKSPKRLVHIYSDKEIEYLFSCASVSVPWLTARNRAIIALMFDSGLRQAEVCNLLHSCIDRSSKVLLVTGKGDKDRFVPIGAVSLALLDDYLSLCPYTDNKYVFVDRMGSKLTCNAIRVFVNRLKHKLPFDLCSHKLRHNFATNYCIDSIRKSGHSNVYDLSIIMGHQSIETTKRYEHFAHEMLATENRISHLDSVYKV